MGRFTLFRWAAGVTLAIVLTSRSLSAQEADTLSISGTFRGPSVSGAVGDDLYEVFANGHDHTWTLTLHGISYSYDYIYEYYDYDDYFAEHITRVHATSFDFEFAGPDADILNATVSQQLSTGSLPDGACFQMSNLNYPDLSATDPNAVDVIASTFSIGLQPLHSTGGVSVYVAGNRNREFQFPIDENGYPIFAPHLTTSDFSTIDDDRLGNGGWLQTLDDLVNIGSYLPPPPPPLPTLMILDGSVKEGDKGSSAVNLTVALSDVSSEVVTVSCATVDGTAVAGSDYTSTNGTLTFQPGQTSRTISIAIKGDRKREPDERFSVQLSNASGATIADAWAIATILNDD